MLYEVQFNSSPEHASCSATPPSPFACTPYLCDAIEAQDQELHAEIPP